MLPPQACWQPADAVQFTYGAASLNGTISVSNPCTAEVWVEDKQDDPLVFRVPWRSLRPGNAKVEAQVKARKRRLEQVERRAKEFMRRHGLKGWRFCWDDSKRRCGVCKYGARSIGLSLPFARTASDAEIDNTVLHEIAHALAGHEHGHDETWKRISRSIGCDAEVRKRVERQDARWEGRCSCGGVRIRRMRRTRNLVCRLCKGDVQWRLLSPSSAQS